MEESSQLAATSGFAYYISPRETLHAAFVDPIHTVLYILYLWRPYVCHLLQNLD